MEPVPIYTGSSGLTNRHDPFSFTHNHERVPLASCSNVDITDNFKIRMRGGTAVEHTATLGPVHSFFPSYDVAAFVEGDALSIIDKDGTVSRLRNVTANAPMSFIDDMYGNIFHANGTENGMISAGVATDWVASSTAVGPSRKTLSPPPVGHLLGRFGGHIVVAYQNWLFFSKPFDPFNFVVDEDYVPLDSPARVIRELAGGLLVSSNTRMTFFAGRDFHNFDPLPLHGKPAVRGTDVEYPADEIIEGGVGMGAVVTTEDSIVFVNSSGQLVNLSKFSVDIPPGASGSAMVSDGRYIVHINTYE